MNMEYLAIAISGYGVLAIAHIGFQVLLGHLNYRRQNKEDEGALKFVHPTVAVFVPIYNENIEVFKNTLRGLSKLKDGNYLKFYIIDDGSTNGDALALAYNEFEGKDERFFFARTKNQGKRMAQYEALQLMHKSGYECDAIVTIDSDTVIAPDGIQEIVQSLFEYNVAAVTGNVMVANKTQNILTEMIGYRYWMAFNQERAAQSYFKVLMCCSGPFSIYRTDVFESVMFDYINQWFLGKKCTYGDDRHLTNLILERGYSVTYNYKAAAYTQVPTKMSQYIKQQIRWNKSFYREMLWTMKSITKHNWYLLYDLSMQFILPFMLIVAVVSVAIQSMNDWRILLAYMSTIVLIGLLRVAYAMYRTKNVKFLKFLGYGFIHVFVLIPVRFYAILTIRDGKWGTR